MDRKLFIFLIVGFILVGVLFLIRGSEDTWICQDGQWIKHGVPRAPMPTEPCGQVAQPSGPEKEPEPGPDIVVSLPQPNQTIKSPLVIEGKARGFWFFEADFPVRLLDDKGEEVAVGYVRTTEDWMTEGLVSFKGELNFLSLVAGAATLVLEKDNPSGLPEHEEKLEIPLQLSSAETMIVKAYFNNNQLDPAVTCHKVFSVEREVLKTKAAARVALEELLKGPTEEEKSKGFFTNINSGVKIQNLVIENGLAKVDFDATLEYQVGGSCRVMAIRAQITETLKQFPTVNEVIISIDGQSEDILQP